MNILVTGGAGYIGSYMTYLLLQSGAKVAVLDDLSTGHADAVPEAVELVVGSLTDEKLLRSIFQRQFDAVFHFAARAIVSESTANPEKYYRDNVAGTLYLLSAVRDAGCRFIINSSSCSVYGEPHQLPISEDHPLSPKSPYGRSKKMVEELLADFDAAYGIRFVSLRYFNAAGAAPELGLGERHDPETHLIPNILLTALGKREKLSIYGNDFPTPDGTAIRDYVHIKDLCAAHLAALNYLLSHEKSDCFNLGAGRGYSIQEVLGVAERIVGRAIPYHFASRRVGDPAHLVADISKAQKVLGFEPRYSAIEQIIADAWEFFRCASWV